MLQSLRCSRRLVASKQLSVSGSAIGRQTRSESGSSALSATSSQSMAEIEPRTSQPLIFSREIKYMENINTKITKPRQSWVENLDSKQSVKLGLIELHPRVFGCFPRADIIQENIVWQDHYRKVNWLCMKTRSEMPGGGRKPWPQKGTGRARASTVRAPQWHNGGWCHGPRGPKTYFFMLNFFTRVRGLTSTLSAKFAQNDIKIVDTFDKFPSDDPKYLLDFMDTRGWGPSVLMVDKGDLFPQNIALASERVKHINLMPVYGLNVHSMLKHETLVFTLAAVEDIEEKLMYQFNRTDIKKLVYKYQRPPLDTYF